LPGRPPAPAPLRDSLQTRRTLSALLIANGRFWPTVAPLLRSELASWKQAARQIEDQSLRELALAKLDEEAFNAEVAATLATLAPRAARAPAVRAIVAFELLFDYLDGRTELELGAPITDGIRLFGDFTGALLPAAAARSRTQAGDLGAEADQRYLAALSARVRENLYRLPAASVVAPIAHAAAERCAQAQTRLHAATTMGDRQLERWAREQAAGSGLEWRAYVAGCASSVLAVHALIAAAADPRTSRRDAEQIDRAYLAIGAVVTLLDSVVDHAADVARGQPGYIRLFANDREIADRLQALIGLALTRVQEAPNSDHHAMTLAGIVAFYTTHPGARRPRAREATQIARGEFVPTIWPAVGVMRTWRLAKTLNSLARRASNRAAT
jgi:tetraprenyl-beta-curcumene synthase